MQIVSIGATLYLGEIVESEAGEGVVLKDSLCLGQTGGVTKAHISEYVMALNANSLEKPISIQGLGGIVSKRDLSDDLEIELEILAMRMKQAKSKTIPELENKKFQELA